MKAKLRIYTMTLMLGMGLASASSVAKAEDVSVSADIGVFSQYVWRGQAQGGGESSVQGDYGVSMGAVSASVWFATLGAGDVTEFDYTIDYSGEAGDLGYSVGAIAYTFMNSAGLDTTEYYLGASYGIGSATYYYDSESKNSWIDLSVGTEVAGFALDATAGYVMPDVGTSEVVNLALGISKEIEVGGIAVSPSFAYNVHMGALDDPATPDTVVFGLNFGY